MIWTLILAAGRSERMGSAKLLLPWGDKTVIEAVVRAALDSEADGTAVVVGSRADEIGRAIEKYPVHVLDNPDFEKGMLSSVERGFGGIPEGVRAVLFCSATSRSYTGPSSTGDLRLQGNGRRGSSSPSTRAGGDIPSSWA